MMLLAAMLSALLAQATVTPATSTAQAPPVVRRHDPFAGLFKSQSSPARPAPSSSTTLFAKPDPAQQKSDDREIICGMVVVHKSTDFDKAIAIPPRDTGSAARRIEPDICRSERTENAK